MIFEGAAMENFCRLRNERFISARLEKQTRLPNDTMLPLQRNAFSRLSLLITNIADHCAPRELDKPTDILKLLPHRDLEAMLVTDEAHQFASDESILVAFKHISSQYVQYLLTILKNVGCVQNRETHPRANPLETDLRLALLGSSQGLAFVTGYDENVSKRMLTPWVHMLEMASAEHSVSLVKY